MTESCRPARPPESGARLCPLDGSPGEPVAWTTVAALARGRVPSRQSFRLCRAAGCDVVYYGASGAVLGVADLNVEPGLKDGSGRLVCYCFLYDENDIARRLGAPDEPPLLDSIRREVEAGNCACEVRNPSGRCCLGEVREATRRLERERKVEP